ncbi:MAG: hypothetical protein K0R80_105 [Clostridia bacterium]|nr:hypothetical protein [Clostridia bacterium]
MKRNLCFVLLLLSIFNMVGCESKSVSIEPEVEEIKATIPFDERRFIYNNGLELDYDSHETRDEDRTLISNYYPVISGLKDKSVQDKINKELAELAKTQLQKLEADLPITIKDKILRFDHKRANAYISYNFNNIIFVEYGAAIDATFKENEYYPLYKDFSYGYDLNTGDRIELDDIFKAGSDYKTKLNNFICQYIIENNYDDYETEMMSKPFQGIRDNQSFTLRLDGLMIILDEKNDEFVNKQYSDRIYIPLKTIGDDLYIFDKYFDVNKSIFEKEKLSKKLFPNQLEYKINRILEEGNERYFLSITQGEFFNVPNKEIEKKLNEMVVPRIDVEAFIEKANTLTGVNESAHLIHNIGLYTNAGDYLSMSVTEEIFFKNSYELIRETFNYDFNLNKEVLLRDLFVGGTDIADILKENIKKMNYPVTEEILELGVIEAVNANKFYFDESGVAIYFSPEGAKLDSYQEWVYVPFESFGLENITILN